MMPNPDLISIVLTLKPLPCPPADVYPLWWGRAAHALLLNVIRQYEPALAEALHTNATNQSTREELMHSSAENNQTQPFTVSTLMGHFPHGRTDAAQSYRLRLSAFQSDIAHILWQAMLNGPLKIGATIELDYMPFRIENASCEPTHAEQNKELTLQKDMDASPWMGITTYQELSAPFLLAKQSAPHRINFQFTAPTTFKSGGKHIPIPLAGLVFGSLLDKWNAFAPIAFPPEVRRFADECLAVTQYRLSTRPVPVKSGGLRMGAVGEISYTCLNYDRYWMSVIAVLAAFAVYSGVGAATTIGMGQCRQFPSQKKKPDNPQ